jgi:hypothetical protein
MQCDDFGAQKVLTWCDARGHREIDPPACRNHAVHAPCARGHVKAVFVDFEPFLRGGGGGGGVVDFGPGVQRQQSRCFFATMDARGRRTYKTKLAPYDSSQ